MLRKFKVLLLASTLVSFALIVLVSVSTSSSVPDGFKQVSKDDYDHLQTGLEHADLASTLKESDVKIEKIELASQNHAGEYAIHATLSVKGSAKKCCILAAETPHYDFDVKCAECGTCTCFDKKK